MARILFPVTDRLSQLPIDTGADAGIAWTPMRFVVDSGLRPIVSTLVDGVDVPMLVHANAGFVVMLTHDAYRRVTGGSVAKEIDYGLGDDLRLSAAGRGHAVLSRLEVAGRASEQVRAEIFDLPTTNWEGMLGVDWLAASGAIVDFGESRLGIPPSGPEHGLDAKPDGCVAVALDRGSGGGRFTCLLSLEPGEDRGTAFAFVASTVAETTIDIECARQHGFTLGEPVEQEHGPSGAVVPVFRPAESVTFYAAGIPVFSSQVSVYDIYAYSETRRPADDTRIGGYVGADVLVGSRAVVEFGVV